MEATRHENIARLEFQLSLMRLMWPNTTSSTTTWIQELQRLIQRIEPIATGD